MLSDLNFEARFGMENGRKLTKLGYFARFGPFFFLPNEGSDVIRFEFGDQILNPLFKAHLLHHKMKGD